jgi:predicted alpha/beta superfamily hydrolase
MRRSHLFLWLFVGCGLDTTGTAPARGVGPPEPEAGASGAYPEGGSAPPSAADAAPSPDGGTLVTTLRVHYPAGTRTIAIRGSAAPLSWGKGSAATPGADDAWTFTLSDLASPLEWKPLLDDATWSRGPNYKLSPGQTLDVYPHFLVRKGEYARAWPAFTSQILPSTRGVWTYLPPTYLENVRARFPVLYMHDGQNLFDAATAFGGHEWKVDETMDAGAEDGAIREAIVIGVENTSDRTAEYTFPAPSKGDDYLKMLTDELKPMVDGALRTLPDRASTAIMGSSLGGLISAYAGVHRADAFGLVGAMSPSTYWNNLAILDEVGTMPGRAQHPERVYVDSGDSGPSNDDVTDTASLARRYADVGYVEGASLHYLVQTGGQHNEIYWAERLPGALHFLLGPRP